MSKRRYITSQWLIINQPCLYSQYATGVCVPAESKVRCPLQFQRAAAGFIKLYIKGLFDVVCEIGHIAL